MVIFSRFSGLDYLNVYKRFFSQISALSSGALLEKAS